MNKKLIILIICIIFVAIVGIIIFVLNNNKIDASKLSNKELVDMFKSKGYYFEIKPNIYGDTHYIDLINNSEGITIERIKNDNIGNMLSFKNTKINNSLAELTGEVENKTNDSKLQYEAYIKWAGQFNISIKQLENLLDSVYDGSYNLTDEEIMQKTETLINDLKKEGF